MNGTHLKGLSGENPLGFLAALGVQCATNAAGISSEIHWKCGVNAYPVISPEMELCEISRGVLALAEKWLEGSALDSKVHPRLYLNAEEIRNYLKGSRQDAMSNSLAQSLVAEGSLASGGKRADKARTSVLDFTAGGKEVLKLMRDILSEVTEGQITESLIYAGGHSEGGKSLSWDLVSDRVYALRSDEPKAPNNLTRPGAEALAIVGLSLHPCFGSKQGILTQGCGRTDDGIRVYTWPLWDKPVPLRVTNSLLAQASHANPYDSRRVHWYRAWGVRKILQSQIRVRGQGHGSFGPPEVIWHYGRDS